MKEHMGKGDIKVMGRLTEVFVFGMDENDGEGRGRK